MTLLLFLLLQITPPSDIHVDANNIIQVSVEAHFNSKDWKVQTLKILRPIPAFTELTFNPMSIAFWPDRRGVVLLIMKACSDHVWRVVIQGNDREDNKPVPTVVVPGYKIKVRQPCNALELEISFMGERGGNVEIQGTASFE